MSGDGSFLVCDKRCVNEKKNMKNCLNSITEVLRRLNAGGECYKQKKNLCDLVLDDLYPYFLHNTLIYRYARHDIPSVSNETTQKNSLKICQKTAAVFKFQIKK